MEKYKYYIRHIIPFIIMIVSIVISVFSLYNNPSIIYEYNDAYKGLVVKDVRGDLRKYTIPDNINDVKVVGIGVRAFYDHNDLEEVIFESPENIQFVERLAFSECEKLKTIDLRYVKEIGRNAFAYDKSLDNIVVSAQYILGSTFFRCESLKNFTMLDGVKTIGSYAFSYTAIEELRIPKTMYYIYPFSLQYMNLKKLYVPYSFTSGNITYLNDIIERY